MCRPIFDETLLARVFLIGVLGIGVVTWGLGIAPGEVRLVPCPVHTVTGVECPGCGMTRACTAAGQGQFGQAWHHHPLVFALLSLALVFVLVPNAFRLVWQRLPGWSRIGLIASGYLAVLGVWISRLVS